MWKTLITFLLVSFFFGCFASPIVHDQTSAAREAVEFGDIVFVSGDVEAGYEMLAKRVKIFNSLDEFKKLVREMHLRSTPATLVATSYETVPGQRMVNIFLYGKKEGEDFHYRVTMLGTAMSGYTVGSVTRGSGPFPAGILRLPFEYPVKPSDRRYPPKIPRNENYDSPTHEQKMWALATCALLTEVNGKRHDMLGGCRRNPDVVRNERKSLDAWWGIRSREDLFHSLRWLEEGGHRRDFNEGGIYYSSLSPQGLETVMNKFSRIPEFYNTIQIAVQYYPRFGEKSIAGWDYSRYIALCGWGYLSGYLSEDEAWAKIMPAARLLQQTFDSWEDLGNNYLIGREYWSYEQTLKKGAVFRSAYRTLCSNPDSPWNKIPWDLDLTPPGEIGTAQVASAKD